MSLFPFIVQPECSRMNHRVTILILIMSLAVIDVWSPHSAFDTSELIWHQKLKKWQYVT